MVASGASEFFYLSSSSLGPHPYQQPQTPQQVLVVKAFPLAALAGPLLSQVGRMVAQQGVKGALSQGAKKVGETATKEGMKQLAQEGAKRVASKEGMDAAMGKLRQEQQKKEAENRQMQQELMEAGRGGASTGSTTMG